MTNKMTKIIFRYFILIFLGLFNLYIFYKIFTPLTVYPVFYILKIFYGAILITNTKIFAGGVMIELVNACIAGSAYYLLTILNLSTSMTINKRIKSLIFIFTSFLIFNISRIIIFFILYYNGFEYFDFLHMGVWYFGSTILLVAVWFINIKIFQIKNIPFYTDFKYIAGQIPR